MRRLMNGCSCSDVSVHPKTWMRANASTKKDWYVHYRFYDPERCPKGKLVIVKGMNDYKALQCRQDATRAILEELRCLLEERGFNPVTKRCVAQVATTGQVSEHTPLQLAILFALRKRWKEYRPATAKDVFRYLRHLRSAAQKLALHEKPIRDFRRRDLLNILDRHGVDRGPWTPATWNNCIGYIKPLFRILKQYEVNDYNPADDIPKKPKSKTRRIATTAKERARIDEYLKMVDHPFWRFVNIFWDSGARLIELLDVRVKDVCLATQTFWITVYKGRSGTSERVQKPIVNTALQHWRMAIEGGAPDDYVFGVKRALTQERWYDICPMPAPATRDVVTRRWYMWVKASPEDGGLGIDADLYSLKHSRTTQLAAMNEAAAADFNGHKSTEMNIRHYDLMAAERKRDALKGVVIPFSASPAKTA